MMLFSYIFIVYTVINTIITSKYTIELSPAFIKSMASNELWHPYLTINASIYRNNIENLEFYDRNNVKRSDFLLKNERNWMKTKNFLSFLQIKNKEIDDNLRNSMTLEKNSESGQLLLTSTKMNCACKFIKNFENNSIDTEKALSTLPRFKEMDLKNANNEDFSMNNLTLIRDPIKNQSFFYRFKEKTVISNENNSLFNQNHEFIKKINENLEENNEKDKNFKEKSEKIIKNKNNNKKSKEMKTQSFLKKTNEIYPFDKNQKFLKKNEIHSNFDDFMNKIPNLNGFNGGLYPSYQELLDFYLRKKEEAIRRNEFYNTQPPFLYQRGYYPDQNLLF